MHPDTKQSVRTICTAHYWTLHRSHSPWQCASGGPGHPSPFQGWAAGSSISTSQPPKLLREDWAEAAIRKMGDIIVALSEHARHHGGTLQFLVKCPVAPQLQQSSFLSGIPQPVDQLPYLKHLKHLASSMCSRKRHYTYPILTLLSWSRRCASALASRITVVFTPPKSG